MAEPQPSTVNEGMDNEDAPLPTNPEDRKAAAAMSSLDARGDDEPASKSVHVDQEALGKAISRLEVSSGKGKASDEGKVKAKEVEEKKKAVKVDQADVMLLVEELDLHKTKATELLKAHEGDAVKAMRTFVTATS